MVEGLAEVTPSQIWAIIDIPATLIALYLLFRGIRRLWRFRQVTNYRSEKIVAWSLLAVDIFFCVIWGISTWVAIATWDDTRPWTIYAFIGISFQIALLVLELAFLVLTEALRRNPESVKTL